MFYLLEDNRIIDSNNFPYEWKFYTVLISEKDEKIILHCRDPRERKKYEIKKQSENVFDLVENGDCYLYQNKHMIKSEICLINDDVLLNIFKSRANETPETILAIYKPNSKGDYIKVWEKKEKVVK